MAKKGARARERPRLVDSETFCVKCDQPNDPDHPLSPHCKEHRSTARRETERKSREKAARGAGLMAVAAEPRRHAFRDGVYSGPLGLALEPGPAAELRAEIGRVGGKAGIAHRATKQLAFDPRMKAGFYFDLLKGLVEAVQDFSDNVHPMVHPPAD